MLAARIERGRKKEREREREKERACWWNISVCVWCACIALPKEGLFRAVSSLPGTTTTHSCCYYIFVYQRSLLLAAVFLSLSLSLSLSLFLSVSLIRTEWAQFAQWSLFERYHRHRTKLSIIYSPEFCMQALFLFINLQVAFYRKQCLFFKKCHLSCHVKLLPWLVAIHPIFP